MNYLLPSGEIFYDLQDGRGLLFPSGLPVGSTAPYIPSFADFGEYHTVIDGATSGWDQYFENIGNVIKFGSTYFLYYVAGDADADVGDDYVHNRQLGVATSTDGVNWTKYAGNPILSFTPEGDQVEEGIGGCVAVVHGGQVHLYYAAMRWITGTDVDAEIRYVVSSDGFNFSGDTLILSNSGDEFYPCAAYVDSGDTFHVYYVGPLTSGTGDLKRLSGSTPNAVTANGTVTTDNFSSIGGIIDLTTSQLLLYNDSDPLDGTTTQYYIAKSALGTLGATIQSLDPNPGDILEFSPQFLKDGDQWFLYTTLGESEVSPYSNRQILVRAYPARPAFQLSPSANIAASAATDTTAILTAPAGKTTGDFEAGKISDDTNPLPSINLTSGKYTEVEFCLEATDDADSGGTYEFRITDNGTPLDTYTEYPEIIIAGGAVSLVPDAVLVAVSVPSPTVALGAMTLAPDPCIILSSVPTAGVTLGGLTVSPDPVAILSAVPSAGLTVGSVTLNPDAVEIVSAVPDSAVALGAVDLTPNSVVGNLTIPDPALAVGGVTLSPDAVVLVSVVPSSTLDIGGMTFSPDALAIAMALPDSSISLGALAFTPDPVIVAAQVPTPSVVVGGVTTLTPDPVLITSAAPDVTLAIGAVSLSPDPVLVTLAVPSISLPAGGLTLVPDSVLIASAVSESGMTLGALALSPDPVLMNVTVTDITTSVGSITITPDVLTVGSAIPSTTVSLGPVVIAPNPVTITVMIPDPLLAQGGALAPQPVSFVIQIPDPLLVVGPVALTPDAVEMALVVTGSEIAMGTPPPKVATRTNRHGSRAAHAITQHRRT